LYSILKLIKGPLKHFWDDDYIAGFISKPDVERVLTQKCEQRCMLLRFCDTQLGAISCSYRREGVIMQCNQYLAYVFCRRHR
jgi:hypothetical protein